MNNNVWIFIILIITLPIVFALQRIIFYFVNYEQMIHLISFAHIKVSDYQIEIVKFVL